VEIGGSRENGPNEEMLLSNENPVNPRKLNRSFTASSRPAAELVDLW
jgi:hypothetical protein